MRCCWIGLCGKLDENAALRDVRLTLVLAASVGPKAAEGFFHELSGMFVFVIALVGLFGLGSLFGCSQIREDI